LADGLHQCLSVGFTDLTSILAIKREEIGNGFLQLLVVLGVSQAKHLILDRTTQLNQRLWAVLVNALHFPSPLIPLNSRAKQVRALEGDPGH
jgi:hypothetical protein